MLASTAFRKEIAKARCQHERAAKRMKAIEKIIADLAADDIVLLLCPNPVCRAAFHFAHVTAECYVPPHYAPGFNGMCPGSLHPFDIRYIGAEDFAAPDPLGVKESKSPRDQEVKEGLDAKEAHEVAELERL